MTTECSLTNTGNVPSSETLANNNPRLSWRERESQASCVFKRWIVQFFFWIGLKPVPVSCPWCDWICLCSMPGDTEDNIKESTEHIVCLVELLCGHVESSGTVKMILQSRGSSVLPSSLQTIPAVPDCTSKRQGWGGTQDTRLLFYTSRREQRLHCSGTLSRAILGRLLFDCMFLAEVL